MTLLYKELLPYDHIIFDWNGTLLSDVEHVCQIHSKQLNQYNLPPLDLEGFKEIFSFPINEFYLNLGFKEEQLHEVNQIFHTTYNSTYKDCTLYLGTLELIKDLKSSGKKLSVLSAAEEGHLHEATEHFGVKPMLHHVYGVANHRAAGKVERGHDLLSQVSIAREKTIIVGDTLLDAEVGKALNIDVLLVADGHQSYSRLTQSGCKTLPSRYV